jgi:hypothetical protein
MVNESRLPAILTTIINRNRLTSPFWLLQQGLIEAVMAGSIPEIRPINPANNVPKEYSPSLNKFKIQYVGQYQCNNPD